MTGGNSNSAPSVNFQPTCSGGARLAGAAKKRVRPALSPYQGHWKLLTCFLARGRGAGAVDVVGVVNSRLGCETLLGACVTTNATAAPAITRATAAARSPRHSQRRETGGMGGNRRRTFQPTRRGARHDLGRWPRRWQTTCSRASRRCPRPARCSSGWVAPRACTSSAAPSATSSWAPNRSIWTWSSTGTRSPSRRCWAPRTGCTTASRPARCRWTASPMTWPAPAGRATPIPGRCPPWRPRASRRISVAATSPPTPSPSDWPDAAAGGCSRLRTAARTSRARRLRVLHDRSFIDDPTRLVRLARYAGRLDFAVEEHTRGLARAAVAARAPDTVSGPRLGAELRLLAEQGQSAPRLPRPG